MKIASMLDFLVRNVSFCDDEMNETLNLVQYKSLIMGNCFFHDQINLV